MADIDGNLKNVRGREKPQIQLFPVAGIIDGALAMVEGAEKYGPGNWRHDHIDLMQYLRAILAHTYAIIEGEDVDPESAHMKLHLGGVLASAAIIADAREAGVLVDDRPKAGPGARMLRGEGLDHATPHYAQQECEECVELNERGLDLWKRVGRQVFKGEGVSEVLPETL